MLKKILSRKKDYFLIILIVIYFAFSLPTISHYLINWDAGQFALGSENYNLHLHQPHPPGYPLFIFIGKCLNYFVNNINYSFIIINLIAGALTIYFFYKLILTVSKKQEVSFLISLLLIFNPIFWYYHNIASTYTFNALTITLISYLTYISIAHKKNNFIVSMALIAILIGFRPSIIIFILPLLLLQLFYLKNKIKNLSEGLLIFISIFLIWFIPFIKIIGGLEILIQTVLYQFNSVFSINTNFKIINTVQLKFFVQSLILGFNVPLLLILFYCSHNFYFLKKQKLINLLLIVILTTSSFYILIHFGEIGYSLSLLPILYLLIVYPVIKLTKIKLKKIIILLIIIEIMIFFLPFSLFENKKIAAISFPAIKKHDLRIKQHLTEIKKNNPKETLVIVLRGQYYDCDKNVKSYKFDDIKILSYYLPDYQLYDFMGVKDTYFINNNYNSIEKHSDKIYFNKQTDKILILADYLHKDIHPQNILLFQYNADSPYSFYRGQINNIDKFEFYGFDFIRQL